MAYFRHFYAYCRELVQNQGEFFWDWTISEDNIGWRAVSIFLMPVNAEDEYIYRPADVTYWNTRGKHFHAVFDFLFNARHQVSCYMGWHFSFVHHKLMFQIVQKKFEEKLFYSLLYRLRFLPTDLIKLIIKFIGLSIPYHVD